MFFISTIRSIQHVNFHIHSVNFPYCITKIDLCNSLVYECLNMTYWIASTNRTNWDIIQDKKVWGIPKRNAGIHSRVKPMDHLFIFISQQKEGDTLLPSQLLPPMKLLKVLLMIPHCSPPQPKWAMNYSRTASS